MHMTTLFVRSGDVQAGMGLQLCMDALQTMSVRYFRDMGKKDFDVLTILFDKTDFVAKCRTCLGIITWLKD